MLHPKARWIRNGIDEDKAQLLVQQMGLHPIVADLLVRRGIHSSEQAERFLHPQADQFHDPMLLHGMPEAVSRIRRALASGEKLRIYGDYDADGVSSTALMVHLLRELNADFDYYIPHRSKEGYGLNKLALEQAKQQHISLIITVDNGISAIEEIAYANELGMDVIVTDHHEPPEQLPEAYALINPKLAACAYPFKSLAGVGVAFKLAHALLQRVPAELTQFAALGTIADLMPLIDENRLIVQMGLEAMQRGSYPGIRSLLRSAGIEASEVTSTHIGFSIGPRINASGRLSSADRAVECLIADEELRADELALEMEGLNKERQTLVEDLTAVAEQQMIAEGMEADKVVIVSGLEWNLGVVGIVAARLLDKIGRPVIVLSIDEETGLAKGSARSIPGFDVYAALSECTEWLMQYGGHQAAAGMTLQRQHIDMLRNKLCKLAAMWLPDDYIPEIHVDLNCKLEDIDLQLIEQLQALAPFGIGNETPRIALQRSAIQELRTIGKLQQHMKLTVADEARGSTLTLEAVGFGLGHLHSAIAETSQIELLGELSVNEWNGKRKPQLIVHDMQIKDMQVFDWRGQPVQNKLQEWLARSAGNGQRAIVVFSPQHKAEAEVVVRKLDALATVWTVSSDGRIVAIGEEGDASEAIWGQVKDVFLYSMPDELWKLQELLQAGQEIEVVFAVLAQDSHSLSAIPARDSFKHVYGLLLQLKKWKTHDEEVLQKISKAAGLRIEAVKMIVAVFTELGFLTQAGDYTDCVSSPARKELSDSVSYRSAQSAQHCESVLHYSTWQELTAWMHAQQRESEDNLALNAQQK